MTLIRTLVFTVPFAWFFGVFLDGGLLGVWTGMVVAGLAFIPIAFGWATSCMRGLTKREELEELHV